MTSKVELLVLKWLYDKKHYLSLASLEEELGHPLHRTSDEIDLVKTLCLDGEFTSLRKLVAESFRGDPATQLLRCIETQSLLEALVLIASKEDVMAFLQHLRSVKQTMDPKILHAIEEAVQLVHPKNHRLLSGWTVRGGRYNMFLTILPILEEIFADECTRAEITEDTSTDALEEIVLDFAINHKDRFESYFSNSKPRANLPPPGSSAKLPRIVGKFSDRSGQPIRTCSFSNSGSLIAIGTNSQSLVVCSTADMNPVSHAEKVHSGSVYTVAWDPEDKYIATGSNDQVIRLAHVGKNNSSNRMNLQAGTVRSIVFQSSESLVAGCSGDSIVRGVDVSRPQVTWQFDCLDGGFVNSLGIDRSKRDLVAVATSTGAVLVIDPRKKEPVWELGATGACTACVAINGHLVSAGNEAGNMYMWDMRKDQQLLWSKPNAHAESVRAISFNSHGKFIATASFDKSSLVIDTLSGAVMATLKGHADKVVHVEWSPKDDAVLATCGTDSTVLLWSLN